MQRLLGRVDNHIRGHQQDMWYNYKKSDRIGWLDYVLAGWIVSAGSYRWIAGSLDMAGSGSYWLDWLDWLDWIGWI